MKIIKTANYKKLEAVFEGSVYTPEVEDKWLGLMKEKPAPFAGKKIQPQNSNKARFRGTGEDRVPEQSLPYAKKHELERNQVFDEESNRIDEHERRIDDSVTETKRRVGVVEDWINWIGDKKVRYLLRKMFAVAIRQGGGEMGAIGPSGLIGHLYHASQGGEGALRQLEKEIGEKIPTFEPEKLNNPNFN